MNRFQVACPGCGHFIEVDEEAVGDQTPCPECHTIFVVEAPPPSASAVGMKLQLGFDPGLVDMKLACYETLAGQGISPESSMEAVQRVFPETDEEYEAHDRLSRLQSRLVTDLFRYPLWQQEGPSEGVNSEQ